MELSIDRASRQPLYRQVVDQIRKLILTGALPPGFRLPPERRLAATLAVNRTTILNAYRELKAEGLVDSHVGRGTAVMGPPAAVTSAAAGGLAWSGLMRDVGGATRDPLLRDLLAISERHDVISLSIGLPAPELLPARRLAQIFDRLVTEVGGVPLLHCPTEGHSPLRASIATWLMSRGIDCGPEEVIVLSGSQQGLDLIARLLLEPGDEVVVEEPTYLAALNAFRVFEPHIEAVATDDDGMLPAALAAALERDRSVRVVYVIPDSQNPSGRTWSVARRRELAELAAAADVVVVEDSPYAEISFDTPPLPAVAALAPADTAVVHLGTLSKIFCPGMRLGWVTAPAPILERYVLVKQSADLHTPTLTQRIAARYLQRHDIDRNIARINDLYRERRDTMLAALERCLPPGSRWTRPAGGLFLWVELPAGVDAARLLERALERNVAFVPGASFFPDPGHDNTMRLNFSAMPPERIRIGVERLAEALEEELATHDLAAASVS